MSCRWGAPAWSSRSATARYTAAAGPDSSSTRMGFSSGRPPKRPRWLGTAGGGVLRSIEHLHPLQRGTLWTASAEVPISSHARAKAPARRRPDGASFPTGRPGPCEADAADSVPARNERHAGDRDRRRPRGSRSPRAGTGTAVSVPDRGGPDRPLCRCRTSGPDLTLEVRGSQRHGADAPAPEPARDQGWSWARRRSRWSRSTPPGGPCWIPATGAGPDRQDRDRVAAG